MSKLRKCLWGVVLLLVTSVAYGQYDMSRYKPLQSKGPMPSDFSKIASTDKNLTDYTIRLKRLVMNGDILYGTKLNDYVNTIVDNLLKDDPVLRSKLHIYIVKSAEVNAYATSNGLVLVNMGLLAQVSNESELAFVLGHEIAHYAEKHVDAFNTYRDSIKKQEGMDYYLKYHNRSRAHELEADRISIERYMKKSPYSYTVMDGIFDVLQYSDLPFDEVPFPKSMVEADFYQFSDKYFLVNITPISNRANMVDTLFTHPNIERRRAAAQQLVKGIPEAGRSVFVQSEALFNEVREIARFECVGIYLNDHQYDRAFYNTYVLQRSHPNNPYLQQALVNAFYGISKHKNYGQVSDVLESYKEIEGEMQQTSYFFSKLSKQEASLLAFREAWKAWRQYPDNLYYQEVMEDVMKDIVVKNKLKYTDFSDYPMGTDPSTIAVEDNTPQDSTINKYARIRQQNKPNKVVPTEKFKTVNYMLVDIHSDSAFVEMMNKVVRQAEDDAVLDLVAQKKQPAEVKSIVITQPQYFVKTTKRNSVTRTLSLKKSDQLKIILEKSAKKLNLGAKAFVMSDVLALSTEDYNKYVKLQQWMNDYFQSDNIEMVHSLSSDMNDVYDLTGTSTFCIAAVQRSKGKFMNFQKIQDILLSGICPYYLIPSLLEFGLPQYSTEMYLMIVDMEKGKSLVSAHDSQESAMSDAYVNAFMYKQLYKFVKGK